MCSHERLLLILSLLLSLTLCLASQVYTPGSSSLTGICSTTHSV